MQWEPGRFGRALFSDGASGFEEGIEELEERPLVGGQDREQWAETVRTVEQRLSNTP